MTFIEIEKVRYPVSFGLNAIRLFCQERNIDMPEFYVFVEHIGNKQNEEFGLDDLEAISTLALSAIREGCRKEKQECDLEMEDVFNLMSDDGVMTAIFSELSKSMAIPGNAKNSLAQPPVNRTQKRAADQKNAKKK
jgi:hypothetical protein